MLAVVCYGILRSDSMRQARRQQGQTHQRLRPGRVRQRLLSGAWYTSLPEEVEEEEESAAMADARACRGRLRQFAGESRGHSPTIGGDREMRPKIK